MIPAQFNYEAPSTLDDAINLLAAHPDEAKILAGGHSLLPAMKLRLAQPALLIDIGRIKDLSYIREEGDQILVGAMTTHYELESSALLKEICPLLPECAAHIGDVQVRNKGTIGGSVAHSDPAGDWPAAIIALGAEMVAVGKQGERTISANDFFVDLLTTALEAGEILREIRIIKPAGRFGHAYQKVRHPASGFAVVGVAAALTIGSNGNCETAAVGITGVASKAYRADAVMQALQGKPLNDESIAAAATHATDGVDANSDLYASEDYRRHLAQVYTRRAISAAAARAS
ncbi:MAG TPA: carbon monoxide dehydrogenase [Blastocatellia bacterium]|jgi:carbon-monoxide dehydrogenase medium subunit|nr:carbon monoxide dehydrogenase [Blastocatellia bacterium]HAF23272.1 carbon monoxide dehydrogenase [Blastocatellia bacterium]HCX28353.1 carbon monoxide dehydrogenase [Blastocatellia bacterium]